MRAGWYRWRTGAQVDAYTCGCMYMSVGKCFGKRKAEKETWGMGKGLGAIFFFLPVLHDM